MREAPRGPGCHWGTRRARCARRGTRRSPPCAARPARAAGTCRRPAPRVALQAPSAPWAARAGSRCCPRHAAQAPQRGRAGPGFPWAADYPCPAPSRAPARLGPAGACGLGRRRTRSQAPPDSLLQSRAASLTARRRSDASPGQTAFVPARSQLCSRCHTASAAGTPRSGSAESPSRSHTRSRSRQPQRSLTAWQGAVWTASPAPASGRRRMCC